MPLARHLTPDSNKNTQVPRTVNTHTELTGGPAHPDCRPPPGRSVTDSHSPRASRLDSTERRRPVAQRDAVWFSATPAQRIVNRSVAERAWTIVIASSPAGYQRNVERQCPPQCRTSTTTGRPALGTTCAWCARYAFCSVRMATCATDAGHLGSSHWVSERRNLNRFY